MCLEVIVLRSHILLIIPPKNFHSPFFLLERLHHFPLHLMGLRDDLLHLLPLATRLADDGEVVLGVEFDEIGEVWLQVDEKPSSQVLNVVACELQLLNELLVGNMQQFPYLGYAVAANVELLQLLELFDALQRGQPAVSQR